MGDHQVETYLPKPWPQVGRVLVVTVAVLGLIICLISFVVGWEAMMTPCPVTDPACPGLTLAQIQGMERIGISLAAFNWINVGIAITLMLVYFFVAGLILWRRPDSVIGLLTALLFVVNGSSVYSGDLFGLIDRYPLLRFPTGLLNAASMALLFLFLCLFPNGRFTPAWTRWLAYIITPFMLLASGYYGFTSPLLQLSLPVTILALVVGLIAQIIRYRRYATPKERQQTKWFLLGVTFLVMVIVILGIGIIYSARLSQRAQMMLILGLSFLVPISLLALPISIGISLLRYRLWDIDVIIRKTIIYSVLTVLLGLVFFGLVVSLQQILGSLTHAENSPLAIVLSTLAIATLFNPLRRRLQDAVDRRFYRSKYNAEQTLAVFARSMRSETDLEMLTSQLERVVWEALQPEKIILWLNSESLRKPNEPKTIR